MKPAPLRELGRFAIVGLSAVGTDFCVYFLASRSGAMAAWLAKTLSFIAGALVSFVFNRAFTFRARGAVHRHAAGFALLYLVTLGLNVAVNALALRLELPRNLAWLAATGASTVANYLGMKFLVFADKAAPLGDPT